MSIYDERNEDSVRDHFQKKRDELTKKSAQLSLFSKAITRPEIETLYANQANLFEWFVDVYEKLQNITLNLARLKTDLKKCSPMMKHLEDYLKKVEEQKDKFR